MKDYKLFETAARNEDGSVYTISSRLNAVYKICKQNEIEYIGFLPDEELTATRLSFASASYHEFVYFAPHNAKKLWIYNTTTNDITCLDLSGDGLLLGSICDCFIRQKQLILVEAEMTCLISIDCESNRIVDIRHYENKGELCRNGVVVGDRYYLSSVLTGNLFEINICNLSIEKYEIRGFRGAWNISVHNNKLWMMPRYAGDPIVEWNIDHSTADFHDVIPRTRSDDFYITYSFMNNDELFGLADNISESVIYDTKSKRLRNFQIEPVNERTKLLFGYKDEDRLYFALHCKDQDVFLSDTPFDWVELNMKNNTYQTIHYIQKRSSKEKMKYSESIIFREKKNGDLLAFLNAI